MIIVPSPSTPIEVVRMYDFSFDGHTIPHSWYEHIRHPPRKDTGESNVNLPAIIVLADICYWYRPTTTQDENDASIIYLRKRFKHDKLQKNYKSFSVLGLTEKQAFDACHFLRDKNLINLEIRTVEIDGIKRPRQVFIGINVDEIEKITKVGTLLRSSMPDTTLLLSSMPADPLLRSSVPNVCNKDIKEDLRVGEELGEKDLSKIRKIQKGIESKAEKRATSINPDWQISPHLKQTILEKICSDLQDEEFALRRDIFVDVWVGRAGTKDGRKTDWDATFRNHVRAYVTNQRYKTKFGKKQERHETDAERRARENREYRERLSSTPGVNPFKNDPVFS